MSSIGAGVVATEFMDVVHTEALRRTGVGMIDNLGSSEEKSRQAAERRGISRA
jgi:hypothetical protein